MIPIKNIHLTGGDARKFYEQIVHPDKEAIRESHRKFEEFSKKHPMKLTEHHGHTYVYEIEDIDLGNKEKNMNGEDVVLTIAGLDINGETIGTILNDMHRGYYNRYTDEYLKHSDEFKELLDTVHTWVPEKEAFVKTFYDESMDKEYHEAMDELNENQPRLYNIKRDILDNGFDMNYQGEEYKLSDTYTVDIEHVKGSDKFTVDVTGYGDDGKYHEYVSVITESEMLEMDYQSLMVRIGEIMNGYDAEAERELQEA